jgi:hypothetical protein
MLSGSLAPEAFYVPINLYVLCMTSQTEAYSKVLYSIQNICGANINKTQGTCGERLFRALHTTPPSIQTEGP